MTSGAPTRAPRAVEGTGIASWSEDRGPTIPVAPTAIVTSLVVWVGRDSRTLSSAYIATDSRISWGPGSVWDTGRKTFASATYPDVFGYVGDVLMPSIVLSQFQTALDLDTVPGAGDIDRRLAALSELAAQQVALCPRRERHPFTLVHCARLGDGMEIGFRLAVTDYRADGSWHQEVQEAPERSAELLVHGSGRRSMEEAFSRWSVSEVAGTSRAVFGAFAQSVASGSDALTGGPVQLVGCVAAGPVSTSASGIRVSGTSQDSQCPDSIPIPQSNGSTIALSA
jgi:hypothetical protein